MRLPPKRRDEIILTTAMLWNIGLTASFFVVVMLTLLVAMRGNPLRPGFLAAQDPAQAEERAWAVEVAGNRVAVLERQLEREGQQWYLEEDGHKMEVLVDFTV